jgi:predicted nucleic acid-binding protein
VIRYLLDTNVVSELRKVKPHGAVVAWLASLRPEQILISAVTMAELQTGVKLTYRQDPVKASDIESWLMSLEMSFAFVPMDAACFKVWARLMAGRPDTLRVDAMIAATARVHGLTVATRNEKDFKHLGVEIVNPFQTIEPK